MTAAIAPTAFAAGGNSNRPARATKPPITVTGWPTGTPQPDWSWLPPGYCHILGGLVH